MQIYKTLDSLFSSLANALWGTPLVILLLGGGLFFAIISRMVPILYFKHAIQNVSEIGKEKDIMGPYLPFSFYTTTGAFEVLFPCMN